MKMADLILANGEKIAKFAKINSLQNYPLYGIPPGGAFDVTVTIVYIYIFVVCCVGVSKAPPIQYF